MIDTGRLIPYLVAVIALFLAPGPSVVLVVSRGVALGRVAAMLAVAGNTLGLATQLLVVVLGPGLLANSHGVFTVLKLLGAGYLVLLGVMSLRERQVLAAAMDAAKVPPASMARLLRDGYVVGLTNPKGLITFTSLAPSVITGSGHSSVPALAGLGLIGLGLAFGADAAWGLASASLRPWFAARPEREDRLGLISALLMIGFGAGLVILALS